MSTTESPKAPEPLKPGEAREWIDYNTRSVDFEYYPPLATRVEKQTRTFAQLQRIVARIMMTDSVREDQARIEDAKKRGVLG